MTPWKKNKDTTRQSSNKTSEPKPRSRFLITLITVNEWVVWSVSNSNRIKRGGSHGHKALCFTFESERTAQALVPRFPANFKTFNINRMNCCNSAISLVCFLLALSLSTVSTEVKGQEDLTLFTIYLVRHAEKQTAVSDPPLTACGEERAVALQEFLSDIPIDAVYSSDFKRTQGTAAPVAHAKGLEIQSYDPQVLEAIQEALMTKQQDALVIGHSNTTAVLAGRLIGEEMGAFDESIYNRIYQVVVSETQQRLHVFHTAFECND